MFESKIDLVFQTIGKTIPVDHGYALYSAVSRILTAFHEETGIFLGLLRGRYIGDGFLDIQPKSELILRLPTSKLNRYINQAGKTLDLSGHPLRIGVPNSHTLIPAPRLYSHLVTTKNGTDQARFEKEIRHQLDHWSIKGKFQVGNRRTFRVRDKQIVGYSLALTELTAEESIRLQEHGLGGRHKMGCGFFEALKK